MTPDRRVDSTGLPEYGQEPSVGFEGGLSRDSRLSTLSYLRQVLRWNLTIGTAALAVAFGATLIAVSGSHDQLLQAALLAAASGFLLSSLSGAGLITMRALRLVGAHRHRRLVRFLRAWGNLEVIARAAASEADPQAADRPIGTILRDLQDTKMLSAYEVQVFESLLQLRNRTVYSRASLTEERLSEAKGKIRSLTNRLSQAKGVSSSMRGPGVSVLIQQPSDGVDEVREGEPRESSAPRESAWFRLADRALVDSVHLARAIRDGRTNAEALKIHNLFSRWALRAYVACAVAYSAIALAMALDLPSGLFWRPAGVTASLGLFLPATLLIVAAARRMSVLEGRSRELRSLLWRYVGEYSDDRLRLQLAPFCRQLVDAASAASGIEAAHLGSAVWRVPRFGERDHLIKVSSFRGTFHVPSGVQWTRGKGVVGLCWAGPDRDLVVDTTRYRELTEDTFEALTDQVRMGLSWEDWRATARLWSIWATALGDDSRFFGCLSVDCDMPGRAEDLKRAAEDRTVREFVEAICALVDDAGGELDAKLVAR